MDSTTAARDSAECRVAIAAGTSAVRELLTVLWQVQGSDLGALLNELDDLASVASGARVAVVVEAETRGEIGASQAGSTAGWVAGHAPSLAAGNGAGQVARLVRECARPDLVPVRTAALAGAVSVPVALTVVSEYARLKPRLRDEAAPTVLNGLLEMGIVDGQRGVRSLRPALLAAHGADGEFQADADAAERLVSLSRPSTDELGALTYQLILDPVGAAALEAAIGPLSAPVPGPDGERDPRSVQTRRGQALVEVCRRATSAADRPASGVKTTLMLTMSYDDLAGRVGAATVIGSTHSDVLIAPETVRRLACDAAVIPTVLGGRGEVLELGRSTRLATPGQLAALWFRDAGCTFPGCTTPAHWCDAHHLVHWADGGSSDLSNLALLCGRHHSVVHRDRLSGTVAGTSNALGTGTDGVTWDLIPGSYHQRRDAGSSPAAYHLSGAQPPGQPPPGAPGTSHSRSTPMNDSAPTNGSAPMNGSSPKNGSAPSGLPTNRSTPMNRQAPDRNAWDTPAPDADPWATRGQRDDSSSPHARELADANPEADPWFDSGPAA